MPPFPLVWCKLTRRCLSDFQLTYAHNAWVEERAGWRTVIYLNLIRSVNQILDILTAEMQNSIPTPLTPVSPLSPSWISAYPPHQDTTLEDDEGIIQVDRTRFAFTDRHRMLRMRLAPLRSVQHDLEVQIGAGATDFDVSPLSTYSAPPSPPQPSSQYLSNPRKINEFYIHSSSGWKETLSKLRPKLTVNTSLDSDRPQSIGNQKHMEAAEVIAGCGGDIQMLWEDDVVRAMLRSKEVKLDEAPGL